MKRFPRRLPACAAVLGLAVGAAAPDPLAGFWGNTLLCTDAAGLDVGHLWLGPDGRFILFGQRRAAIAGTYAPAAGGPPTVCLHVPDPVPELPPALPAAALPPPVLGDGACLSAALHAIGDRWAAGIGGLHLTLLAGRR